MALVPWKDQNNNDIVDQSGVTIVFRDTQVQILPKLTVRANCTVVKPMGKVRISMNFKVSPRVTKPILMASKISMLLNVNAGISNRISNWGSIMFPSHDQRGP